jgi:hypothetical protein
LLLFRSRHLLAFAQHLSSALKGKMKIRMIEAMDEAGTLLNIDPIRLDTALPENKDRDLVRLRR